MMVKLGDKKEFVPTAFNAQIKIKNPATGKECVKSVIGRVVYIHPAGRYYTVEAEIDGRMIRESFLNGSCCEI